MNGIALTVILSQIPKLFGFSVSADGPLRQMLGIVEKVWDGSTNVTALAIGGSALALILVLEAVAAPPRHADRRGRCHHRGRGVRSRTARGRLGPRSVAAGTADAAPSAGAPRQPGARSSRAASRSRSYPSPTPACSLEPTRRVCEHRSTRTRRWWASASRTSRPGFFQGFPISSSSSRTPVAEAAGAKTQLTGVVGALAIALLLVFAPSLLQDLPNTALGGDRHRVGDRADRSVRPAPHLSHPALGVLAVDGLFRGRRRASGAIPGIVLAIVIAVIEFLWDGWRPHSAVLGRVDDVKGYHDITRYPNARLIPGLVLFRWDAPLFFANAEFFHDRVLDAVASSPTPVRWLVVAAEPVTSIDVTAADAIVRARRHAARRGHRDVFRRDERSGQGQAEALRALRALRRAAVLCHDRGSGQAATSSPIRSYRRNPRHAGERNSPPTDA